MEGRSYKEISAILDVSETALESLIFRARRSLAEELENLVTCDRAELALSQQTDGRLGRKERKRLVAHLDECPSCARVATLGLKRRRAFKGLAIMPLPFSLTLFKGAPSASAAIGLPTIGGGAAAGTAAGVGGGAIAAKIAIGVAAVAVASGAGYQGVQAVREPATPVAHTQAVPAAAVPAAAQPAIVRADPRVAKATPAVVKKRAVGKKSKPAKKPHPVKARATAPVKGNSSTAPGQTKQAQTQGGKSEVSPGRTNALVDAEGQEHSGTRPDEDHAEAEDGSEEEGGPGRRQDQACARQDCHSTRPRRSPRRRRAERKEAALTHTGRLAERRGSDPAAYRPRATGSRARRGRIGPFPAWTAA